MFGLFKSKSKVAVKPRPAIKTYRINYDTPHIFRELNNDRAAIISQTRIASFESNSQFLFPPPIVVTEQIRAKWPIGANCIVCKLTGGLSPDGTPYANIFYYLIES